MLLHCHAGCNVESVLGAVGVTFDQLYPERINDHHRRPERRPWNGYQVLAAVVLEVTYVGLVASSLARGEALTDATRRRLWKAVARLNEAEALVDGR